MDQLSYSRHRFPPPVIQHSIWLYLRFTLSYRDVEELLAERGLEVSYETVRRWVLKFGSRLRVGSVGPVHARPIGGISTRGSCELPVGKCICAALSITRASFSICWFSVDATSGRRCG